ncbi:PIN domain-containing protein [Nostocoides sp. Soil756]|jgi:hypothetical protein|uniref:PIN domain-containing protein n=1 Tax=Nostocoides sp. Soil756 TaxID=1736399 RepID=UPI0006FE821D|nr:PIN domain-containing protein [Tetrasphaera sp. Soil756]KRE63556.1 hypothetical protein ASG78_01240 [Tetrasphaera sp. Soil756]
MKSVVLDATQLTRDYMCRGLPYQLIQHMLHSTWVDVYVPASVFEETVANFAHATREANSALERLNRSQRLLGLPAYAAVAYDTSFDYRSYLAERFDEQLGITVLPWPKVDHEDLVRRAVERRPPFDAKGGGYRDSLVWADVVNMAARGFDVALVSHDKAFAGPGGGLARELAEEVRGLAGAVELVIDFGAWLVDHLPWKETDLRSAVGRSRDEDFCHYYLQSDLQNELEPAVEELGFTASPLQCNITSVEWGGELASVEAAEGPDGMVLVKYDLSQDVAFEATFLEGFVPEQAWNISEVHGFRGVRVNGVIPMIARVAVLFGDPEFGFTIEDLSWRRVDGRGRGLEAVPFDPDHPALFDLS